jgi:hypothetical protein
VDEISSTSQIDPQNIICKIVMYKLWNQYSNELTESFRNIVALSMAHTLWYFRPINYGSLLDARP